MLSICPSYQRTHDIRTLSRDLWNDNLGQHSLHLYPLSLLMSRTSTYLNFARQTEEAFNFYKSVFGTEFLGEIQRFSTVPTQEGQPPMKEEEKNLVMHVALPIVGGHILMGTDAPESMGFTVNFGNNIFINLEPDTRAETDQLFAKLSEGGKVGMQLQEMFWGAYFGSCTDKYGVQWMFNCNAT